MDSNVAIALMSKAKRVYEQEGTFLAMPLAPITFSRAELDGLGRLPTDTASLRRMAEFARLVNTLPTGVTWPFSRDDLLWDVHSGVLARAVVAKSILAPDQAAALAAAQDVVSGPKMTEYDRHRAAWFDARENYALAKADAELSTDGAVRVRWREVVEPEMAGQMRRIEALWETAGHRTEIDGALRTIQSLSRSFPSVVWQQWADACSDLAFAEDPALGRFAPTTFAPADIWDGPWMSFTLDGGQVRTLVQEAPAEVRARLAPDAVDLRIANLSFQATTVRIVRPWFAPELYASRFWRYTDGRVSDGAGTATDRLPAYIAAMVLGRNLSISLAPAGAENTTALKRLQTTGLSFGAFRLSSVAQPTLHAGTQVLLRREWSTTGAAPVGAAVRSLPNPTRTMTLAPSIVRPLPARVAGLSPMITALQSAPAAAPIAMARRLPTASRLAVGRFERLVLAPTQRPEATAPQAGSAVPSQAPDNDAFVLGFIVRRTPPCPDPDPTLSW